MGRSRASTPAGRSRSRAGEQRSGRRTPTGKRGTTRKPPAAGSKKPARRSTAARKSSAGRKSTTAAAKRAPKPERQKRRGRKQVASRRPRRSGTASPASRTARRRQTASRRRGAPSWRLRLLIGVVVLGALAAGYMFWLRDSSLVAVTDVEVVGVSGSERGEIVAELTRVGEGMTTLHADRERIERAAARYPTVESVSVDPNFPHGLRIEVSERPPRLLARAGDEEVPVASDGTVLSGVVAPEEGLPVLELDQVPATGSLGGEALEQALVLGAAPAPLRPLIEAVKDGDDYGVEVSLRGEIPIRFGTPERALEKWSAAAAVLADPKLDAATYVDVRVPERPSVGGAG